MPEFSARDVKALRDATGAGMMDAKKALEATDGEFDAAVSWLRERGLGKAAERSDRENMEGAVAVAVDGDRAALVELKTEADFAAKSAQFVSLVDEMAAAVATDGEGAVDGFKDAIDDLRITLKENIELGQVVRFVAEPGHILDSYIHFQNGRGVNGVLVEMEGGDRELAHDIAVHIAFGKPSVLTREEVPQAALDAERAALEAQTRNEGKPEQAWPKIVEGKINGWYKRVPGGVLLEQPFARDDKKTVTQVVGDAKIIRFAQAVIGS